MRMERRTYHIIRVPKVSQWSYIVALRRNIKLLKYTKCNKMVHISGTIAWFIKKKKKSLIINGLITGPTFFNWNSSDPVCLFERSPLCRGHRPVTPVGCAIPVRPSRNVCRPLKRRANYRRNGRIAQLLFLLSINCRSETRTAGSVPLTAVFGRAR